MPVRQPDNSPDQIEWVVDVPGWLPEFYATEAEADQQARAYRFLNPRQYGTARARPATQADRERMAAAMARVVVDHAA